MTTSVQSRVGREAPRDQFEDLYEYVQERSPLPLTVFLQR